MYTRDAYAKLCDDLLLILGFEELNQVPETFRLEDLKMCKVILLTVDR